MFISEKCWSGEGILCRAGQIFAGILCVFQGNLTRHGGKFAADTMLRVMNTASKRKSGVKVKLSPLFYLSGMKIVILMVKRGAIGLYVMGVLKNRGAMVQKQISNQHSLVAENA